MQRMLFSKSHRSKLHIYMKKKNTLPHVSFFSLFFYFILFFILFVFLLTNFIFILICMCFIYFLFFPLLFFLEIPCACMY